MPLTLTSGNVSKSQRSDTETKAKTMTRTAYRPTTSLDRLCHALGEEITQALGRNEIAAIARRMNQATIAAGVPLGERQTIILDEIHQEFDRQSTDYDGVWGE